MAALKNLVEAFLHWHEEEAVSRLTEGLTEEEYASIALQHAVRYAARGFGLEIQDDEPALPPTAISFLFSLPLLKPHDLPSSQRECSICSSTMHAEDQWWSDHRLEVATRLPCGHVIGYRCLEAWLNPLQGTDNNTCPYCRAVCFEKMAGLDTVEGLQERLGVLEWGVGTYHSAPTDFERAELEWFRMKIVGYWLDKVLVEMGQERVELAREIEEQVAVEPTVVSTSFSGRLMEFDVRRDLVDMIGLQMRTRQLGMEAGYGEVRDLDGDVHSGVVDHRESGGEVGDFEEGEIVEDEEVRDEMAE